MNTPLSFACPRCARDATADFYGPCERCRADLVSAMARESKDVERAVYEPKMNVVPNQVATKD